MKMEYAVQTQAGSSGDWTFCTIGPNGVIAISDIKKAKKTAAECKKAVPGQEFRIVCRMVSDWCECKGGSR